MKKKGFTLIELLATIVILSIILSISGYIIVNIVNKGKEKSYKVTLNEISINANNYMIERKNEVFFIPNDDGKTEYQCLTIQSMIDKGYLKETIENSEVAKDVTVKRDGYIYIERDIRTKNVTKSYYVLADVDKEKCNVVKDISKNIIIKQTPTDWSREKNITIVYNIKNYNISTNFSDYTYDYKYSKGNITGSDNFTNSNVEMVNIKDITENGIMSANIINKGKSIAYNYIEINKIDRVGPVVTHKYTGSSIVTSSVKIPLELTDVGIGPNYDSFTTEDFIIKIGNNTLKSNDSHNNYSLTNKGKGKYELDIKDITMNGVISVLIPEGKIEDKLGNLNKEIDLTSSLNITAMVIYNVTYHANGGNGDDIKDTATYGENFVTKKNTYTRNGYSFNGWNEKSDGKGKNWSLTSNGVYENGNGTKPWKWTYTKDIDLYAQWKANTYTVSFDAMGGTVSYSSKNVTYNSTYGSFPTPTKTGYKFDGWYTDKENGDKIVYNTKVAITSNQTLYAHYNPNTYKVTYYSNGGAGTSKSQIVTYGKDFVTLENTYTRNHYTFNGWNEKANGTGVAWSLTSNGVYENGNGKNPIKWSYTNGIYLYAQWVEQSNTITFDKQGGTGGTNSITATYSKSLSKINIPSKNKYTFEGYYTDKNGLGTKYYNSSGEGVRNWYLSEDKTLYANWIRDSLMREVYKYSDGYFLSTSLKKDAITKITFTNSINGKKANNTDCWDVGAVKNGLVLAWISKNVGNGKYELTIGQNGGVIANKYSSYLFQYMNNLTEIKFNNSFDTSDVIDMSYMFYKDEALKSLDLSSFDTKNVTTMHGMFLYCENLVTLNVSKFNTSKVTDMSHMFYECKNLTNLSVSGFDTSNVTTMKYMFTNCEKLTTIDVSRFNTSKVTNMAGMFYYCTSVTNLNLSKFDTSKVTDMYEMFFGCISLPTLDISKFDTRNVTNMSYMLGALYSLRTINVGTLDTSNVTDMSGLFSWGARLTSINGLEKFNTSKVTDMSHMFHACGALTNINITNFDTTNVRDMTGMFASTNFTTINIKHFKTDNLTKAAAMFANNAKLTTLYLPNSSLSQIRSPYSRNYEIAELVGTTMYYKGESVTYHMFDNDYVLRNVYVKDNNDKTFITARIKESPKANSSVRVNTY